MSDTGSRLKVLECRACCTEVDPKRLVGTCPSCGHTLFARYRTGDFDARAWWASLEGRPWTLFRYREMLPVHDASAVTTLGEGCTAILDLGAVPGAEGIRVSLKDDGTLPTGSFKARGMAVAVSRARELGARSLFAPTAGNAGIALAAYAARSALPARVYLPEVGTEVVQRACRAYGAEVVPVRGTIRDAGEAGRSAEKGRGSFEMSTLREPYRLEGKKTMGYEILEQLGQDAPDAIVYPTGGGTGLVGMYKAFEELRELGLTEARPRFYAVQPEGCAPVVRALREDAVRCEPWDRPVTLAPGLLVPAPFASERILESVRTSRGGGVTVSDAAILEAMETLSARYGISAAPEGAAPWAALPQLVATGAIRPGEHVLLYNTGTGIGWDTTRLRVALRERTASGA
jgi:threonine synthase